MNAQKSHKNKPFAYKDTQLIKNHIKNCQFSPDYEETTNYFHDIPFTTCV